MASDFLESIIDKKNRTTNIKVVFVDIVSYSKRRSQTQALVIDAFMEALHEALDETAKEYVNYAQDNGINFKTDIIILPSGDGAAVCFPFEGVHDIHLFFGKKLVEAVHKNNSQQDCPKFNDQNWCNCHANYTLTIGISEGKSILYKDVNNNYNVAGNAINMAARAMAEADANQIFFTEEAYSQLIDMVDDPNMDENFISFEGVKIKHGLKVKLFQYVDENTPGLNTAPNEDLIFAQKFDSTMNIFKNIGFNLPSPEGNPQLERTKAIEMMEQLGQFLTGGTPEGAPEGPFKIDK